MTSIDHFRIVGAAVVGIGDFITQFIQRLHDNAECPSFIMAFQVFNVLQYKDGRPAGSDNSDHIKEQRSLGSTRETVGPAQRIFLRYPGERKRLARKARKQDVVIGYMSGPG